MQDTSQLRSLRITYLHQHFTTPDDSSGTRSFEFAKRFVEMGHTVNMIAADPKAETNSDPWRRQVIDGIQVGWANVPYSNQMSFNERIRRFLQFAMTSAREAARIPADIVFATSTPLTIAIPAAYVSRRLGIPLVFEVRDLWPEMPIAVGALRNPIARYAARRLEQFAYDSADHIVALSPGMAAGVRKLAGQNKKVSVIPNSCDSVLFGGRDPDRLWLERTFGIEPKRKVILYGGTLGLANHVGYLVDLAKFLKEVDPNIAILIVGSGAEWETVKAKATSLNLLNRNVFLHGGIPKSDMPHLLASVEMASSVFTDIPEMWHNSANKFFDALAAARPILINYGGWQADLLIESGAGFRLSATATRNDATRVADALADRYWMSEASKAASGLARSRFDRDDHARALIEILETTSKNIATPVKKNKE